MRTSPRLVASGIALFLLASPLAAQAPDISRGTLTLSMGPALVAGFADELVYRDASTDDLLSRLRWQMLPVAGLRIDLRYTPRTGSPLSLRLNALTLLPTPSGTMVDEDWDAPVTGDTLVYGRSRHAAFLSRGVDATLSLDVRSTTAATVVETAFGASVTSLSWEGWNGEGYYDYLSASTAEPAFSGLVIAYQTLALGPSFGFAVEQKLGRSTLRIGLQARFLLLHLAIDSHVARGLTFYDSMHGSFMLRPELRYSLPLGEGLELDCGVSGHMLRGARGDTTIMDEDGNSSTSDNTGGQTMTAIETSILLRVYR